MGEAMIGQFKKLLALCGYPQRFQSPLVLAQRGTPSSVTGTTTETVLATIAIPAGAIGTYGSMRVTTLWSYSNSANLKTLKVLFGGAVLMSQTPTTTSGTHDMRLMRNRGVANSQVSGASGATTFGTTAGGVTATAVDTSAAQNLEIRGTLANAGETITLESYAVEILNP
ncbi:hypothetical protein [Caballeronia glebae]|uniref:hypothetical protein n=1 Tax=Caballeronia glebae TaxID=1777143 RepID=UPI0038B92099